jgi:hypothetical protein
MVLHCTRLLSVDSRDSMQRTNSPARMKKRKAGLDTHCGLSSLMR